MVGPKGDAKLGKIRKWIPSMSLPFEPRKAADLVISELDSRHLDDTKSLIKFCLII